MEICNKQIHTNSECEITVNICYQTNDGKNKVRKKGHKIKLTPHYYVPSLQNDACNKYIT